MSREEMRAYWFVVLVGSVLLAFFLFLANEAAKNAETQVYVPEGVSVTVNGRVINEQGWHRLDNP